MSRKEDVGGLIDYINGLRIKLSAREEVANEYKERIDKAIEVIKTKYPVLCRSEADFKEELLNILNGGNDKSKGE